MTVTWTSGYGIDEAEPFIEWGSKGGEQKRSPAGTLTFDRSSMCGAYICKLVNLRMYSSILCMDTRCIASGWWSDLYTSTFWAFFTGHIWASQDFHKIHFMVYDSSYNFFVAGAPARTVGWRDPGFIHTSFLKELWPNSVYVIASANI